MRGRYRGHGIEQRSTTEIVRSIAGYRGDVSHAVVLPNLSCVKAARV
jgi:hypothetical protein